MSKGKVLVIGSNANRIDVQGGWGATGNYLNETVVPIMAFIDAGYDVVFATPDGTKPHMDAASDSAAHFENDQAAYKKAKDFWNDSPVMNTISTLRAVIGKGLDGYAGFFLPGGQAPVADLMQDADLGEILRHFHEHKKPTALLCHGPISLVAAMPNAKAFRAALVAGETEKAKDLAKGWPYAGYKMTVFTASEETVIEDQILHAKMYFYMPPALTAAGGDVQIGLPDFAPHVVVDRELITGQNPRSDHPIAAKLVEALNRVSAGSTQRQSA